MPSFDGIQRGHTPAPRPRPEPIEHVRPKTGRAMPRNAGFFVGAIVLVAIFAVFRPNSEASSKPTKPATNQASKTELNSLPPQLATPPSSEGDTALDKLVILDKPTDSSKPQSLPESDATPTDSTVPQTTPSTGTDATVPSKSSFTIRILNGGGKAGAAAALRNDLTKQSFKISSVGNAQQTYPTSLVYYQTGKQAEAELVAKTLAEPAVTLEENAIAKPTDLLIVIGTDRQ